MPFPASTPSYTGFTSTHTLAQDTHAAQHNQEQADIIALSNKVGTGASTPTSTSVLVGNGTGTSAWGQVALSNMVSGVLPITNGGTGTTSSTGSGSVVLNNNPTIVNASLAGFQSVLSLIYPVGCIYTETTGTNPATTFGFGTWISFGSGRVLVGNGTSDQTFTAGTTGGESNHTLTSAEMPSHTHVGAYTDNNWKINSTPASAQQVAINSDPTQVGNQMLASTPTGGGGAHNNLQPYIVVYFWQRTA